MEQGSSTQSQPADRPTWLTSRRAITIVVLIAAAVRLMALCSTPLIVTWDGGEYIIAAMELREHGRQVLTPYRTPGYPLLLAASFEIFGTHALAVLAMQHLLGVLMCAVAAWAICRLAGPWIGLAIALLLALEPIVLSFEAHALSESPSTVFAVLCTAVALADRRALPRTALLLGVLLGIACLIRPGLQTFVPFYALALAIRHWPSKKRTALCLALVAIGFLATVGPWLAYNHKRGITGLARGTAIAAWYGLGRTGLLIEPPPYVEAPAAAAFHRHLKAGERSSEAAIWQFYNEIGVVRDQSAYRMLARWHRDSVRAAPGAYISAVGSGALWLMDIFPNSGGFESNQHWFMLRFGQDAREWGQHAANYNMGGPNPRLKAFEMQPASGGWIHEAYRWYASRRPSGWPQAPLFIAMLAAAGVGIWRRNWVLVLVCTGSLAYLAVHAAMLLPQPRYGLPVWSTWYLVLAAGIGCLKRPVVPRD